MIRQVSIAAASIALMVTGALAQGSVLTGKDAFGNWEADAPGVVRKITADDLEAPFVSESASNAPENVARPEGAMPKVPDGFKVELVASGIENPRAMTIAPNGDLFVADTSANQVRVYRIPDGGATPEEEGVFSSGMNEPYGVAFYPPGPEPEWIYIANTDSVVRYPYKNGDLAATGEAEVIVPSLPSGGHSTRGLVFSPDGQTMFVSVGSESNVAEEMGDVPDGDVAAFASAHALGAAWGPEERRANVLAFNPDGSNERIYATGLRNCAGMGLQPETGLPWCAVNERDALGDNIPFDYATSVTEGAYYGWPWYYIGDHEEPRLAGARTDLAGKVTVPDVLFQAHSAALNIAFNDSDAMGADYKGDAFVALHGSWNRGTRTGYKVVRLPFENGKPTGEYEDFVTGFVMDDASVWGRPVGVAVAHDGSLFVSEDGSGTIWRVSKE